MEGSNGGSGTTRIPACHLRAALGLLLLVYASPELAPTISSVSTVNVGTGLLGYLGNKGAVATRIVLGDTTKMVFVNCHLASGHENCLS